MIHCSQTAHGRSSKGMVVIGLSIIALGGLLLAGAFGLIDVGRLVRHYWPLIFIIVGAANLLDPAQRVTGAVFIAVGSLLLVSQQRWVHVHFWPMVLALILLLVGGAILWRAFSGPPQRPLQGEANGDFVRSHAILSGTDLRPVSRTFRGADLLSVFGGIKLDLRDAQPENEAATIDLYVVFGGVELLVPSDWSVESDTRAIMAGFVDHRRPTSAPAQKTLLLRGLVLMGGVEIKN